MGKKVKPLKIKQYKIPEEKHLVIINPWGVYRDFDDADFNHIGAWFERMLQEDYPDSRRIKSIYYQRTHRNIIVELPKEVKDVEPFLGAHFHSKILNAAPHPDEVPAYIYEYKYASFGDPAQKSFVVKQPMYDTIPGDFPIKEQYPLPSPAPPPPKEVPYARAIPPEVNERIANRLLDATADKVRTPEPQAGPSMISHFPSSDSPRRLTPLPADNWKGKAKEIISAPSDRENKFTEYVRPAYLNSMTIESSKDLGTVGSSTPPGSLKMDPYDEEEETKRMLKFSDDDEDAHVFLASIIKGVKMEETPDDASTYKPSSELLNALGSLPKGLIEPIVGFKAEETEESKHKIKLEPESSSTELSNYQPSGDLLAALATLSDNMNSSESWKKPGLPRKGESPNKRHIQDILWGNQPESPKRIKREA